MCHCALIEHLDREEKQIPGTPMYKLPSTPTLAWLCNFYVVKKNTLTVTRKTLPMKLHDNVVWGQRSAQTEEHLETLVMLKFLINDKRKQWGCTLNKGFGLESILVLFRTLRNVTTPKEDNADLIGLLWLLQSREFCSLFSYGTQAPMTSLIWVCLLRVCFFSKHKKRHGTQTKPDKIMLQGLG